MNSEDKIYNKIKNASQNGEKDFPGMDKVWSRVEEKLDTTIVVKKKNTWQKLAIAATVLLSFSIIYHFVANDEIIKDKIINNTANQELVSKDSVNKIIEKAKEVVVDNNTIKEPANQITNDAGLNPKMEFTAKEIESNPMATSFAPAVGSLNDAAYKIEFKKEEATTLEEKEMITTELSKNLNAENKVSMNNSALNSSNSNNGYVAQGKKYDAPLKKAKYKSRAKSAKSRTTSVQQTDDLVVIDGVVKDKKELDKMSAEEYDVTHFKKPLYLINGIEYTEESLFGKNPTSPYAPLDKQEIITINSVKATDAMKIYGKKGENGIIIITTKDGKPVKK